MSKNNREMRKNQLSRALSILSSTMSGLERYKNPPWLKCDFNAPVWVISNSYCGFCIDWERLQNHFQSVYSPQVPSIDWDVLKYWLAASTHWDALSASTEKSQSERIRQVVTCIDYLLINHQKTGVVLDGLASLTLDDYAEFIDTLAASGSTHLTVYQWPERVAAFFREQIKLDRAAVSTAGSKSQPPELSQLRQEDGYSDLTPQEAVFARKWLWKQGLYERGYGKDLYYYRPNLVALGQLIYPEILTPHKKLPMPPELCFMPRESYEREYPGSPVVNEDLRMSRLRLSQYGAAFNTLRLLRESISDAPILTAWPSPAGLPVQSDLKETGRYLLPTAEPLLKAFSKAVDFYVENSAHLFSSYEKLARLSKKKGCSVSKLCGPGSVTAIIDDRTVAMGVMRWSLNSDRYDLATDKDDYFHRLRSNASLWELLCVLMGSAQLIIGTLSARRVTELCELEVGQCVDRSAMRLVFRKRKKMAFGIRQPASKPIPEFAVRVLEDLNKFHMKLSKIHGAPPGNVFDRVTRQGMKPTRTCTDLCYNSSLDLFFDYIQMPRDEAGRRFYLRQHQLRRFFAVAFFWNNSFNRLDAIRSFLGHTNAEETYRYISEAMPGEILSTVKAQWLAEHIGEQVSAHEELASAIASRFGTRDYNLIGAAAMKDFLTNQVSSGNIRIEPIFIKGNREYKIAVLVKESRR